MADEVLATLVAVLAGAVLAIATLAGAYLLRRIHDQADRILRLEIAMDRLLLVEADAVQRGRNRQRRLKGGGA
jgi:hypothetical protein